MIGTSFPTLPMRVAVQNRHRKQAVYRIRIGMRAGDRAFRYTLSGPAFATDFNLPATQSVASVPLGNWIAAVPPFGMRKLARALSGTPNRPARLGPFLQHRWILNFPGSLSRWSFRTLLQSFQESSCVKFILCRPHVLSFAALHAMKHAARNVEHAGKSVGEVRNV